MLSPRRGARADGADATGAGNVEEHSTEARELTALDSEILAMEARTFRHVGGKERRIREELGLTPTAYLVRLNRLLDEPAALREAPAVVHRLRARRESQQP